MPKPLLFVLLVQLSTAVECFRGRKSPPSSCGLFSSSSLGRHPRGGSRHDRNASPEAESSSSIFSSIARQSSKALAATARGSTRMAADLVRPKDVDWNELVGWWRLDIALDEQREENDTPPLAVRITGNGRAHFTDVDGLERDVAVEFRPASWPRSAKLKFATKDLIYECSVQRKLANLEILKLRGKVYTMRRFQGKVQVGSFVGRRRVVIMDDDDDEEEEEEPDEEYDSEEEVLDEKENREQGTDDEGALSGVEWDEGFDTDGSEEG